MLNSRARRTLIRLRVARRRRLAFYETVQQASGGGSVVDGDEQLLRAAPLEADGSRADDDRPFPSSHSPPR